MGFLSDLFKGFRKKSTIDEAVEELFQGVYNLDKGVNIIKYVSDYSDKYGFICEYVITDSVNCIRCVIVLLPHNGEKDKQYKNFLVEMKKRHVKVINFYSHLPNEKEYVISRIRNFM